MVTAQDVAEKYVDVDVEDDDVNEGYVEVKVEVVVEVEVDVEEEDEEGVMLDARPSLAMLPRWRLRWGPRYIF